MSDERWRDTYDRWKTTEPDWPDDTCQKCHGEGVVEWSRMGTTTPETPVDEGSGLPICPHCHGSGREP